MKSKFLQFLGLTKRAGKLVEGYNMCEEAVKHGKGKLIILSQDCSKNTKDKFQNYSNNFKVTLIQGYSKEELGNILGREEINVLCVIDSKMGSKLLTLWNEDKY
jgi:ribosomal protein L7Ae-like RNA K-turn-binding protein